METEEVDDGLYPRHTESANGQSLLGIHMINATRPDKCEDGFTPRAPEQQNETDGLFPPQEVEEKTNDFPLEGDEDQPDDETKGRSKTNCPCIQEPEGKQAWFVAFTAMCLTFCVSSEIMAFGIYYVPYAEMFNLTKAQVGWIKGIQTITAAAFCE